jgi:hypothetical protein
VLEILDQTDHPRERLATAFVPPTESLEQILEAFNLTSQYEHSTEPAVVAGAITDALPWKTAQLSPSIPECVATADQPRPVASPTEMLTPSEPVKSSALRSDPKEKD